MIELFTFWLAGFCTGVAFTGGLAGWLRYSWFSRSGRRMGSNPPPPYCKPQPPSGPPQPLAADLIRYTRWRDEQIRRAVTEPIRFDEGPTARTTSGPGPTTPKPDIVPGFHGSGSRRTTRWFINNPVQIAECGGPCTVGPTHCDCGALWVDVPTTNQPPTDP